MGRIRSISHVDVEESRIEESGKGVVKAEDVLELWDNFVSKDPLKKFISAYNSGMEALQSVPENSRLGKEVRKPIKESADKLFEQVKAVNKNLPSLKSQTKSTKEIKQNDKLYDSSQEALFKLANIVKKDIDTLGEVFKGIGDVLKQSVSTLEDELSGQAKDNIDKNYEYLHATTVGVFLVLGKVNTGLSIIVTAVSSIFGQPQVGAIVNGTVKGMLAGAQKITKKIQTDLDKQDDELISLATPLLPKDQKDMVTLGHAKLALQGVSIITKMALEAAGVNTEVLDAIKEVQKYAGYALTIENLAHKVRDKISNALVKSQDSSKEKSTVKDFVKDKLKGLSKDEVSEVQGKLNELKKKLEEVADEEAKQLLEKLNAKFTGVKYEGAMDVTEAIDKLAEVAYNARG